MCEGVNNGYYTRQTIKNVIRDLGLVVGSVCDCDGFVYIVKSISKTDIIFNNNVNDISYFEFKEVTLL